MGSAIELELMADERSKSMIREAARRHRAEQADRTSIRRGIVAALFGLRRAA
jgi:hypothetical protein